MRKGNLILLGVFIVVMVFALASCGRKAAVTRQPEKLPEIFIETKSDIQWEKKCACEVIQLLGGDSTTYKGKIKCRGGFSSKYEKHSYSLKLSDAASLCALPANKNWILNASYIDKTFMRHKLCYDLFRMMDERNLAPQCAYVMLRVNHQPKGLYVLMQRLNKQVLQVDKKDPGALIFKEPKLFYKNLPERKGKSENYHEQIYPDFEKVGDQSAIIDDFRQFILHSSDAEFARRIGEWVDVRNIIDWHLLLLFVNSGDGVCKNFYLYKQNAGTPFRVALWDCDHSFGRDGDNERNMLERIVQPQSNILLERLLKMPSYQEALAERYGQLRENGVFSYENIQKMVQDNDRLVRLGIQENIRLWPYNSPNYFDSNSYDEEVKLLLQFVPLSLQRLDEMFHYRQNSSSKKS